jgi:RNA polymerase sigma-70 factor (ECF subfamily)
MRFQIKNHDEVDDLLQYKDFENAVNQAIESLPEKRKTIFYLHRFDGLSYKEIARVLGISIKTVETQIRRSLKYLEKQLIHFLSVNL